MQNLSRTLIVVILIAVLGGSYVLWRVFAPAAPSQPGVQSNQTGGNPYPGSTNVTVTSGATTTGQNYQEGQTQIQIPQGALTSFSALVSALSGSEVTFQQATAASTGDLKTLYNLYSRDIAAENKAYPTRSPFSLSVALIDITDDGVAEALVYEELPDYCGSGGCTLDIYQKKQGAWIKIFTAFAGGEVAFGNTYINGYLDLYLEVHGDVGSQTNVMHYTWSGTTYKAQQAVAVWDGTAFELVP